MNTKSPATIAALESQLHINCKYGPWTTARWLLQDCWKKNPRVIRDATYDLRDLPFKESAYDIAWCRELTPDMIGKWVHHFDKNSQFLAAMRSAYNGIADPSYISGPAAPGRPGIYHVTDVSFYDGCMFDGKYYPKIIEDGQVWITNEVLLFALRNGYEFTVTEAWVFEDCKRILDPLAKRLWDARAALKGVNEEAYHEIKKIAVVSNGAWATGKHLHEGIDMIHPNWWADTVGQARTALLANLAKYGSPVLVETDGLYYVSRDENWRSAVPGILDRMNDCGGYKHEGSFLLTEELYNEAQAIGSDVGALAKLFKVAGGEK